MRVVVLYNEASQDASVDERDILAQRDAVAGALSQLGHRAIPVACTLDLSITKRQLDELRPDAVFNLVESLGGTDRLMPAATLLLEALNIPYTGNPTQSILTTSNKLGAKQALRDAELPTPVWWVGSGRGGDAATRRRGERELLAPAHKLDLPSPPGRGAGGEGRPSVSQRHTRTSSQNERVIVKAIWEHASFNMDDAAVVTLESESSIEEILRSRDELTGRPHFAEAYIEGREFNLTLLAGSNGPLVLPPAEIDFTAYPDDKPRIVGYSAKWDETSFEYVNTPRRFEFSSEDEALLDKLSELAACCWYVFDLRGYARVDFRVDEEGQPWILEVNANPCLAPDAGFAAAVEQAGIGYEEAIRRILDDACSSPPSNISPPHFA